MNLSVAVAKNWGIGCQGDLVFRIKDDLKRFRQLTTGKVVVMGRKTLESLKDGKPLPKRDNIVLSREAGLVIPGAIVCGSASETREVLKNYQPQDIFIIGGGDIYAQFLDDCKFAYITKVDATANADAFFPNIDEMPHWRLVEESQPMQQDGLRYSFCLYQNEKL
ncbi:MAG: dihydrofolate reductase [Defluviitaleaceae bacterium]|nr:dihydrofolate reductase [Defluviitaleaceae bacterium]